MSFFVLRVTMSLTSAMKAAAVTESGHRAHGADTADMDSQFGSPFNCGQVSAKLMAPSSERANIKRSRSESVVENKVLAQHTCFLTFSFDEVSLTLSSASSNWSLFGRSSASFAAFNNPPTRCS
jgi:hypothetical protein